MVDEQNQSIEKVRIKRIGAITMGLTFGIGMALTSFVMFLIFFLIGGLVSSVLIGSSDLGLSNTTLFLIFIPIIYFIIGFIMGALGALIYNYITVKLCGGIDMELSKE